MELLLPAKSVTERTSPIKERKWDKDNSWFKPSMETVDAYVGNDLWQQMCDHLETNYQSSPVLEFSKCSAQHGWNVKYKKSGRSLCTLYPQLGYFIALIVVGPREVAEFEMGLPLFSEYLQDLYHKTRSGMGQKWLMIEVRDAATLEDVKQCLTIRKGKKEKQGERNDYCNENTTL